MKIGLIAVNVGGEDSAENMVRLTKKAEEVGLESMWTFEHTIVPMDYASKYPYHPSGRFAAAPETSFIDPLIALAHIAAVSKTLRLGTGINIIPQANPLLLAKQVASLDHLSGGRMMLGVGVGWLAEEFEAMGTPFEGRGARMDDYLTAIKKVWSGEVVEHQSEFINWSGFKSYPLPVQKPHVPIIVGGTTPAAIRRVVAHGDGWITVGTPDELAQAHGQLRKEAEAAGRAMDSIEITSTCVYFKEGPDGIKKYQDIGAARVLIPWSTLPDKDPIVGLDKLGDELLSKL